MSIQKNDKPDFFGRHLVPEDRSLLLAGAGRYALVMGGITAIGWFGTGYLIGSKDPLWQGIMIVGIAFAGAFVWKWWTLLQQVHAMMNARGRK